ncbi:MAG TPA: class I SAM-dependent methyltransferase [Chthoniobacterales bacterium]|nr:class I SAM-dependent methyltransferase [Chthoniobacterales bacterium]
MQFKDHFSTQAADYAKFRPRYPALMFKYLGEIAPERKLAWDCATGNGQAAVELANVFDRVIATDASEKQIANAERHKHVDYRIAPAENSGLDSYSVDLVMVAQALHWFDLDRFYPEVNRVLQQSGVFAASAYRFFQITPEIDRIVNHRYYREIVGPHWPAERTSIEKFEEIPFPLSFSEMETPPFEMTLQWNLQHLLGYLSTWSATQRFIAANKRNPLDEIERELRVAWGDTKRLRRIVWPLTLRAGIKVA